MSTLLGFLGVGIAQLMRQLWTLVVLVLEPGAPPATCDDPTAHGTRLGALSSTPTAPIGSRSRHSNRTAIAVACILSVRTPSATRRVARWRGLDVAKRCAKRLGTRLSLLSRMRRGNETRLPRAGLRGHDPWMPRTMASTSSASAARRRRSLGRASDASRAHTPGGAVGGGEETA